LQVGAEIRHRFNLVGDRSIPYSTLARCVVDTAVAMGNQNEQSFFRSAAQIHIAKALEALDEADFPVTLENVHNLLLNPSDSRAAMARLRSRALVEHFEQYLGQPPEQLAGVVGTVRNYLQHFTVPAIAEVFCRDSTFSMRDVDEGRIVCVAMPQLYQTERRFVATFLKLLFFNHALARFDLAQKARQNRNLLVLVADECQQFVTVSEHGMSDHNVIDVLREARVAVIAATQSTTSLVPVLGAERARVYTLNLRHRLIFGASDELDAKASAEFIGRGRKREKTYSWYGGRRSVSVRMVDEFHEKPEKLTQLPKHECILVHAEAGYRKVTLPPLEADGTVSKWYHGLWLGS
jgi:type IV secretory pathway TraG/TraD family ATPase VirD4